MHVGVRPGAVLRALSPPAGELWGCVLPRSRKRPPIRPQGEEGKTGFLGESPAHCRPEQRGRKGGALPLTVCDFLGMGAGGCRTAVLDRGPRASVPERSTPVGPK